MNRMELYMTIKIDVSRFQAILQLHVAGVFFVVKIDQHGWGASFPFWQILDPPLLLATGSLKFALTQPDTFTNLCKPQTCIPALNKFSEELVCVSKSVV